MPHYWATPGLSQPSSLHTGIGSYSSLHQERAYLLSALAAEEYRFEQVRSSLEKIQMRLAERNASGFSAGVERSLRKVIACLTCKLKRNERNKSAMINNLAAVTTTMQMMDQHQWRKAHFEYCQASRVPLDDGLTTTMEEYGNSFAYDPRDALLFADTHQPVHPSICPLSYLGASYNSCLQLQPRISMEVSCMQWDLQSTLLGTSDKFSGFWYHKSRFIVTASSLHSGRTTRKSQASHSAANEPSHNANANQRGEKAASWSCSR